MLQGALNGLQSFLMPLKLWPMRIDTPILVLIIMQQVSRYTTLVQLRQARHFARPADDVLQGSAHTHEPTNKRHAVLSRIAAGRLAPAPAPAPPAAGDMGTGPTAAACPRHEAPRPASPCTAAAAWHSQGPGAVPVSRPHEGSEPCPGVRRLGGLGNSASWQGIRAADGAATWQGTHAADEATGSKAAAWRPVGLPGWAPVSSLHMSTNLADCPSLPPCSASAPQDDAVVPQLPAWVPSGMASTSQVWDSLPGSSLPGLPESLPGLAKEPVTQRRDDGAEPLLSAVAPQPHLAADLVPDTSPAGLQGSISRVPSLGDPTFAPLLDELLSWQ